MPPPFKTQVANFQDNLLSTSTRSALTLSVTCSHIMDMLEKGRRLSRQFLEK